MPISFTDEFRNVSAMLMCLWWKWAWSIHA